MKWVSREGLSHLSSWVMILAVLVRVFPTAIILPLVVGPGSAEWFQWWAPILVAIGATALSFTRHRFLAAILALLVCAIAIVNWSCALPIWRPQISRFVVVPDLCLAIAGVTKWLAQSFDSAMEDMQDKD